jgi:hypothetical protein
MGLFDSVKAALGIRAEADATSDADPEDLFGMSTAYVTMYADLDFESVGEAALCFSAVDSHGYNWVVLTDDDEEDLVTSIHFAADTLVERGYGSRLLAAVFGFERARDGQQAYWVYSFRRGAYYPFVPDRGDHDRQLEFKLDSVLDGELSVEPDKEYWYPLWPDRPGGHPWE